VANYVLSLPRLLEVNKAECQWLSKAISLSQYCYMISRATQQKSDNLETIVMRRYEMRGGGRHN